MNFPVDPFSVPDPKYLFRFDSRNQAYRYLSTYAQIQHHIVFELRIRWIEAIKVADDPSCRQKYRHAVMYGCDCIVSIPGHYDET